MTCWQISMMLPGAALWLPPQLMLLHSRISLQPLISGCRRRSSKSVMAQNELSLDEAALRSPVSPGKSSRVRWADL